MGAQFSNLVFQVPEPPCYGASFDGLQWVDTPLHDKIPIKHTHWTSKQDKPAFFTILYLPGHAEDMGISNSWLNMLSSTLRSNIITFDYPGYGLHAGKPSEKGCFDTAIAVYNYLTKECAVPPSRIILMGKNIGAAVAIHLYHEKCSGTARKKGVLNDVAAGIVLQTPFTSICGVAKGKVPRNHDLFDSRRKIERINCPTFFVHGLLDEVITTKHSRKLSSKISQQTWKVLELEEFGQMIEYADDFLDDFLKFIQVLGGSDPEFKETHAITTQQTPAMFRSTTQLVTQFLETIGMSQYSDKFIAAGFFDMQHLIWMDEIDLMCLEIDDQSHVQKIFEAIKKLRPAPSETADEDQTLSVTDDTSEKSSSSSSKDSKPVPSLLKRSTDLAFDDTAFLRFFRFLWSIDSSKPLTDGQVKTLGGEYKARLKVLWSSMVPYRSIEERTKIVSKGYNGETWEGCHNGQPIQIKVMNFKRSNIRSFAQQVVRLLSISHHNVVETLAASIDPEQPICLINRHYPEAIYLSKYLKGNAFLSLQDRIDVCLQIAEALLFLHQQQPPIVLGDFNSTNVLIIDPRPKPAKTLAPPSKLAQEVPPSPSSSSSSSLVEEKTRLIVKVIIDNAVTETKIPALRSMSPELQTNRTGGKSTAADVYSFGFLMYEIFNNRAVFDMLRSPEVALRCAIEFLRPTYEDMNPSLTPKSVFSLINKCWAVSPAERPPISTIIQELSSSIPDSPSDLIPHPTDPQRPRIAPEDASSLISLLALPSAQLSVYQNILIEGAPLQTPRSSAPKPVSPEDAEESSHGSIFWPKLSDIKKAGTEKGDDIGKITIETASDAWKPFEAMGPLQKRHVAQLLSTVNQEKFSDLIILSGTGRHKQRLYGHRSIVASRCPSLSERIESFSDSSFSIIELPELQPQALLLVLGFFYSGWIPLQPSIIFSVYEAAHFLHCTEVTNLCLVWCRHNSIPDNVLSFPQGPPLAASMSLSSSAASSSSSYSSSPPTSSLMVPGLGQSQMSTYGVPNLRLSCMLSAPSDDPSVTTSFPYSSKQRIENVMESLRQVENGIKNIESQLNNFNSMRQLNLVSKSKRPKEKSSSSSSRRKRTSSSSSLSVIAPGSSPQMVQSSSTSSVVSATSPQS